MEPVTIHVSGDPTVAAEDIRRRLAEPRPLVRIDPPEPAAAVARALAVRQRSGASS